MNSGQDNTTLNQEALLKRLGSWNKEVSREAERQIQGLGKDGTTLLLEYMNGREAHRNTRALTGFIASLPCWIAFLTIIHPQYVWVWFISGMLMYHSYLSYRCTYSRRQEKAMLILAASKDMRTIFLLLNNLSSYPNKGVRQAAASGLCSLLPRLRYGDFLHLAHRQQLRELLNSSKITLKRNGGTELLLAVLKGLEQVGNSEDIPIVRFLAAGKGIAAEEPAIREAAQTCLPYLLERSDESNSKTLLRPSTPGDNTLLRASALEADTTPEQLLRAGTPPHRMRRLDAESSIARLHCPAPSP